MRSGSADGHTEPWCRRTEAGRSRSVDGYAPSARETFWSFAGVLVVRSLTASGHLARRRGPFLFMLLPARKFCLIRTAPHVTDFLKELIAPAVQSFSFAKNLFANHRAHFDHCAWRSVWAVASIRETPCHAQPKKIDATARTMATADASADRRLSQRHIRMCVGACACTSRARRTSRFEQSTRPDRSVDEIEGNEAFRNPEGLKMPPISLRWPWCRSFQRVWPRAASRRRTTAHVPPATCPWQGTAGCRAASAWWSRPDPKRPCAAPH